MAEDLEALQEMALAIAQAIIQNAMDEAGIKPAELARRMGKPRSFVTRMMRGNHNLSIKTFILALTVCGHSPNLSRVLASADPR